MDPGIFQREIAYHSRVYPQSHQLLWSVHISFEQKPVERFLIKFLAFFHGFRFFLGHPRLNLHTPNGKQMRAMNSWPTSRKNEANVKYPIKLQKRRIRKDSSLENEKSLAKERNKYTVSTTWSNAKLPFTFRCESLPSTCTYTYVRTYMPSFQSLDAPFNITNAKIFA